MLSPPIPEDEIERLQVLQSYEILDTAPEQAFDDLVVIAASICRVPMGSVTLIDRDRQWFKARHGLPMTETPREFGFSAHAILDLTQPTIVQDAREDPRFRDNPMVAGDPNIRFYAGAPLLACGQPVGSFCVMDDKPSRLERHQIDALEALSRQASAQLELRKLARSLNQHVNERLSYERELHAQVQELEARNRELTAQARTDPLTGLDNRRGFAQKLGAAIATAAAEGGLLHIAIIDVDRFKGINDRFGHQEGDRVLQKIAKTLGAHGVARGRVARYGGEEFVLLVAGITADQARQQCDYLRKAVADLATGFSLTVSIGLASYRRGDTPEKLLARADQALYRAKRSGRDRVEATD